MDYCIDSMILFNFSLEYLLLQWDLCFYNGSYLSFTWRATDGIKKIFKALQRASGQTSLSSPLRVWMVGTGQQQEPHYHSIFFLVTSLVSEGNHPNLLFLRMGGWCSLFPFLMPERHGSFCLPSCFTTVSEIDCLWGPRWHMHWFVTLKAVHIQKVSSLLKWLLTVAPWAHWEVKWVPFQAWLLSRLQARTWAGSKHVSG